MSTTVSFNNVTKKYQLGLTRTSFPALAVRLLKSIIRRPATGEKDDQTLWALRDVSFDLKKGESLALVGSNGAGKTTILKLLANITQPTVGSIALHGQLSALIELGAGFHPDLTGRENIFLNGTILGLSRKHIEERLDEIIEFSEIERFIDTPVKRYSSGMIVRLGFAIASSIEPDILLIDEVLAVGDAAFQQKCLRRIRDLINRGTSIIFVSHNFYLVQAVCQKALYLEKGQVKHFGPTKEVIKLYEHDLHLERARKYEAAETEGDADEAERESTIKITAVEVYGPDLVEGEATLSSKEAATIVVKYDALEPIGAAHMSVFIIRSDGSTCCMMRTKLDDAPLHIDAGSGSVTLTIDPLQLVSGTYFAKAWFLNESDSMNIGAGAGRSDWFMVSGAALSYEESSGVFEPHTQWAHDLESTAASLSHNPVHTGSNGQSSIKSSANRQS